MLVHIVIVPNADRSGPDLDRIGKVEDVPDDLARLMLTNGTAREPTDEELAGWRGTQAAPDGQQQATSETPTGEAPQEAAPADAPAPDDAGAAADEASE